jgi:two-component system phosphate regulon sensor histidine kinase PhoR
MDNRRAIHDYHVMKRPLLLRVFLWFAAVILFSLLAFTVFSIRFSRDISREGLRRGLERTAEAAITGVGPLIPFGRNARIEAAARDIAARSKTRITVIDADGTVLADSEQDPAVMENHAGRPEIAEALSGKVGSAVRLSSTLGKEMLYVAVPYDAPDGLRAVVRASTFRAELDASGASIAVVILIFAASLLAVSLLAALALSRGILTPLGELAAAVRRFAGGDFKARILLPNRDEIGRLAGSFNDMAERVQGLFEEVSRRTGELDGIFSSVTQGIALLDGESRILRANRAFTDFTGAEDVEGKRIWEVARAAELVDLVNRARLQEAVSSQEIEMGEKTFLCSVTKMGESGELIAVLYDTSETRRLEEVKRDFVTNASHELRTPLTSIRGYLELLRADADGEKAHWLEAVSRNTERMTAIVEDLLRLSRLEGGSRDFSPTDVDLGKLVRETAESFRTRIEGKSLAFSIAAASDLPRIHADPFQLEQMLVNLIDNAVKYTEAGEIRVSVRIQGDRADVEVADTGIGIPREHVGRIFERFYVVDKSRSRKLGGTGLGLSIVKHIATLHGGSVHVESAPGKGTRLTVRLPVLFTKL